MLKAENTKLSNIVRMYEAVDVRTDRAIDVLELNVAQLLFSEG